MPATPGNIAVTLLELGLLLSGLVLLWRHVRSRRDPATESPRWQLEPWNVTLSDFLLFSFLIIAGGLVAGFIGGLILARFDLPTDTRMILGSAAFQLGLLIGPTLVPLNLGHHPLRPPLDRGAWRSGIVTFLIALPVVTVVNLAWLGLLKLLGLPVEQQDLLRMFTQAEDPALIILMVVLATMVAPVTEELLFRATLFRYLRTRVPRWIALVVPGTIFAALHVNWMTLDGLPSLVPLITLAVIFSLAYERTGRISTAMIAHGLFNLHTILLLLSGITA
jgi:membrane protease YdiL (CAAX protease family)